MYLTHNDIKIVSGEHTLQKQTKSQVRKIIKEQGSFRGYFVGNKANPYHIADGWHLGQYVNIYSLPELDRLTEAFELGLYHHMPEMGNYTHYYRIID